MSRPCVSLRATNGSAAISLSLSCRTVRLLRPLRSALSTRNDGVRAATISSLLGQDTSLPSWSLRAQRSNLALFHEIASASFVVVAMTCCGCGSLPFFVRPRRPPFPSLRAKRSNLTVLRSQATHHTTGRLPRSLRSLAMTPEDPFFVRALLQTVYMLLHHFFIGVVSIPSSSGHFFRRQDRLAYRLKTGRVSIPSSSGHFFGPSIRPLASGEGGGVSIPSSSGHFSRLIEAKAYETQGDIGFNPFFVRALLQTEA